MKTFKQFISEDGGAPANSMGAGISGLSSAANVGIAGFDPVMSGMFRRSPPAMVGANSNKYRNQLLRLRKKK